MALQLPPEPPAVEQVVVTAPRLPATAADRAFSVTSLDEETLSTAERLDEALGASPGAALFRRTSSLAANPTTQGLSLRAIAPSGAGRALVTLDGVPQNDPFGGWLIWSSLPPETVDAADVIRGAGAGPYGAGALTGVVALHEADGTALDLSAGEYGRARAGGSAGLALGQTRLFGVAAAETSAGYVPVRDARRGAADTRLSLSARSVAVRATAPIGEASAAVRLSAYEEARGSGLRGADSRADGAAASVTVARQPTDANLGWRLQAWARKSDLQNRSVAVAPGRASTSAANDQFATPATGWGVNAAVRRTTPGVTLELGADARRTEGEAQERFRNLGAGFTRERVAGGATTVAGAYLEAVRTAGPWTVAGGVRLDAWSVSDGVRRERDLLTGGATLDSRPENRDGVVPTARAALRREVGPVFVRAAAYAGFRPPTLNELHRPFRVGNDITEANAELEPERLYGVEAALGGEGTLRWSATAFYNRLADPVTNVTVGVGPGTFPLAGFVPAGGVLRQRRNAGRIDAVGLEGDAEADVSDTLSLRAAFAYTAAEVDGGDDAPQLTGLRPAQAPRFTAVAGASWRPVERAELRADLRYESRRFEDDLNSRVLSPALTADLRASWRVRDGVTAYAAADNLFDADVEVGETADGVESLGPPRMLRVGLSWRP